MIERANIRKNIKDALQGTSGIPSSSNRYVTENDFRISRAKISDIGTPGGIGFGVGICPEEKLPSNIMPLVGTYTIGHDDYGNYKCIIDNSIMVWIPKFYYRITNDINNPYYGTKVEIKSALEYKTEAEANADNFALHRAFIDGGEIKDGFFVDKYKGSLTNFIYNTSGILSSIKNGNPISSSADTKRDASNNYAGSFSNCLSNGQVPADIYGGAWSAVKSRGNNFAVMSIFIRSAIAMLSLAHAQASTSTSNCAWYDAISNFPKGNNNYGADINDATCTFTVCDDGYWSSRNEARKNGSGSTFAKTTHNGQNCGISDINGNQWEVLQGLTTICASKTITAISRAAEAVFTITGHGYVDGEQIMITGTGNPSAWDVLLKDKIFTISDKTDNTFKLKLNGDYVNSSAIALDYISGYLSTTGTFYTLKESIALKNVTGGNSLATTDHFADAFILANMNAISLSFLDGGFANKFGNGTNQVLSETINRTSNNYRLTNAGLPMSVNSISPTGSNNFGQDYFYEYFQDELCVLGFGDWTNGSSAGVWYLALTTSRTYSHRGLSARACLYV